MIADTLCTCEIVSILLEVIASPRAPATRPLLDVLREEALVEVVADRVVDEGPALLLRRAARLVAEDDVVVPAPLDSAGRRLRANQQ